MFEVVWFDDLKQLHFFSYLFFLTVGLGSFEKIPETAEQCQHFEAICNKNTAFAGTQSSRLTSLCGKFGPSPRDSFEVKNRVFCPRKNRFLKILGRFKVNYRFLYTSDSQKPKKKNSCHIHFKLMEKI